MASPAGLRPRPPLHLAVFLLVFVAIVLAGCGSAPQFRRLTLVNPTDYNLIVELKGESENSWLVLGRADRKAQTVKEQVIDVGDTWVFRFSYVGEVVGEQRSSRDELASSGWRFTIPASVGESLAGKGFAPSAG